MRFYTSNYGFHRTGREDGHKGGTAVAVTKGIPHVCVDLPPLLSVGAAYRLETLTCSSQLFILLAKSGVTDITELSSANIMDIDEVVSVGGRSFIKITKSKLTPGELNALLFPSLGRYFGSNLMILFQSFVFC
jgi:hypothetical protein